MNVKHHIPERSCKHCEVPLQVRTPRKRKPGRKYWFAWYYVCTTCKRQFMPDEARVNADGSRYEGPKRGRPKKRKRSRHPNDARDYKPKLVVWRHPLTEKRHELPEWVDLLSLAAAAIKGELAPF